MQNAYVTLIQHLNNKCSISNTIFDSGGSDLATAVTDAKLHCRQRTKIRTTLVFKKTPRSFRLFLQ